METQGRKMKIKGSGISKTAHRTEQLIAQNEKLKREVQEVMSNVEV